MWDFVNNGTSVFFEWYYGTVEKFDSYNMVNGRETGSRLSICRPNFLYPLLTILIISYEVCVIIDLEIITLKV